MSLYDPVNRWNVPANLLPESIRAMALDGARGNEGVAFWLGKSNVGTATISHLVTLSNDWVVKRPDYLQISEEGISQLTNVADHHDVFMVGQIHSHPGTFVDLSLVDRKYGFSVPYFLSVVAPYYAQRPHTTWSECGIHVYERGRGFRRLHLHESKSAIAVQGGNNAELIHLGRK
jgi:proteasome lid subunit RPN8/RPN11